MKKMFFLLIVIAFISNSAFSQLYAKFSTGYNRSFGNQILAQDYKISYYSSFDNIVETNTNQRSSLGKGFTLNGAVGYDFNRFLAAELGFSYLFGTKSSIDQVYIYSSGKDVHTIELQGRMLSIVPSFILSYEMETWKPYLAVGMPFSSIVVDEKSNFKTYDNSGDESYKAKYTGSTSIGLITRAGIQIPYNERFVFFGEIAFCTQNFSPDNRDLESYSLNGQNAISTLNESDKHVQYSDEAPVWYEWNGEEWVETYNTNEPHKKQKFDIPFSFAGINIGVKFNLFKRFSFPWSAK